MTLLDQMEHKYPELKELRPRVEEATNLLLEAFRQGRKLLVCGNGGSAADAEHIVGEMMKGFMLKRPVPDHVHEKLSLLYPDEGAHIAKHLQGAIPAISLVSQHALTTAIANDTSAEMIFAQQVYGYGKPGDVLLALSTSGNSVNVVRAAQVAKAVGLRVIGLTGRGGGALRELSDVAICVPYDKTPEIQERHLPIYHLLCMRVEKELFSE